MIRNTRVVLLQRIRDGATTATSKSTRSFQSNLSCFQPRPCRVLQRFVPCLGYGKFASASISTTTTTTHVDDEAAVEEPAVDEDIATAPRVDAADELSPDSMINTTEDDTTPNGDSAYDTSQSYTQGHDADVPHVRLSKWLSQNGGVSRREAERLILDGRVTIAGETIRHPGIQWRADNLTAVKLKGKLIRVSIKDRLRSNADSIRVWLYHKPIRELITTAPDPKGRETIRDRLRHIQKHSKAKGHVKTVGRLDYNSEGLLVLTDSGDFARTLELPKNQFHRTYRVRVHGPMHQSKLNALQRGLTVDNTFYRGMKAELDDKRRYATTNHWLKITCTEGKNRQIRVLLKQLGLTVMRLIRISFGDYHLNTIPPGMAIEVPYKSLEQTRKKGPLFPKRRRPIPKTKPSAANTVQWVRSAPGR